MIHAVEEIPLEEIKVVKRCLSRRSYTEASIDELAENIKRYGLLQPIGVTPIAYKKYQLIYGWRRLMAIKKLKRKKILAAIVI